MQQVEKEIRVISHELKNETISPELNFISLIETLLEKQSLIGKFNFKISNDPSIEWDNIDDEIKINLHRIIQEGLFNISKYAKAKNVRINFKLNDKLLNLNIEDDGVGFDAQKNKKGIGLLNMQSRTHKIGGEFIVDSVIGNGTKLTVLIYI